MIIELNLQPEVEKGLLAKATARGVSLLDYVNEIVAREVRGAPEPALRRAGQDLVDACAELRGILTDEEVDTLFRRNTSSARPVNFE